MMDDEWGAVVRDRALTCSFFYREVVFMTKREMVVRIAEETGIIQQDVHEVIQRTLDLIVDSLEQGRNVELRNFGVFQLKQRKQRIGRNPNRPEQVVEIPSRRTVKFKPGKIMKERVTG